MVFNSKKGNWIVRHKILLTIGFLAVLIIGALLYLLIPNTYTISGRITNNFNEPVKDINLSFGDKNVTTNKNGEYQISGINNEEAVKITIPTTYAYVSPKLAINYKEAQQKGFKVFQIQQDVKLEYNVRDFVDQTLTNMKYTRHNIIWSYLDKSSQEVFGTQDAYEKFFKAAFGVASPENNIKDYTILADKTTVREKWTSPQGIDYSNVFEVPYEETENNGSHISQIFYAIPLNNKLIMTSSYTKDKYETAKKYLIDSGYLDN